MTILILGGTGEARALAKSIVDKQLPVISSLAGRVNNPQLPVGECRIGGFGGSAGLIKYLTTAGISAVVDATHPFAATISAHAVAATSQLGIPYLRFERPGWSQHLLAAQWNWVANHREAAQLAAQLCKNSEKPYGVPLLTVGRQSLVEFIEPLQDLSALVRVVDPPTHDIPNLWKVIRSRGPYEFSAELELLKQCDVLVTKDSGGTYTEAKLFAAQELQIPVVIVCRPELPKNITQCNEVSAAVQWIVKQ